VFETPILAKTLSIPASTESLSESPTGA
jgi:hypothetical protein